MSELASDAVTGLMGPSTPWLAGFADHGIDLLAGVEPVNIEKAFTIASEGGGTRHFGEGVRYAVTDIVAARLAGLERLTTTLSRLDLAYKRQWDARNGTTYRGTAPGAE